MKNAIIFFTILTILTISGCKTNKKLDGNWSVLTENHLYFELFIQDDTIYLSDDHNLARKPRKIAFKNDSLYISDLDLANKIKFQIGKTNQPIKLIYDKNHFWKLYKISHGYTFDEFKKNGDTLKYIFDVRKRKEKLLSILGRS